MAISASIKHDFIYSSHQFSTTPNNFKYFANNPSYQFEILSKFNYTRVNLYSGLGLSFVKYTSQMNFKSEENYLNALYGYGVTSLKIPIRVGYTISPKFEFLIGTSLNLNYLDLLTFDSKYSLDSSYEGFEYFTDRGFTYFPTISANSGFQMRFGKLSCFIITELDFLLFPKAMTSTTLVRTNPNKNSINFNNSFSVRLGSISLGVIYSLERVKKPKQKVKELGDK